MKNAKRWLLPDGVEEVLPNDAKRIEHLRRRMIDQFERWGYQLVIPPVLEFTDSLLSGVGSDLDPITLKVTDQLSGKMMGLRPDMTPQAARMDAHSISHKATSRLCYAGHVMHARPASLLANRTPLHAGVELFGEASLAGDIEVTSLLLACLEQESNQPLTLALGHVAIYKHLIEGAALASGQQAELFELLQAKSMTDLGAWLETHIQDLQIRQWLSVLPKLCGDQQCLQDAREQLKAAPQKVLEAIDELSQFSEVIAKRYPAVNYYFDLSELRGYHYHTGIVFSAFGENFSDALANGGRYDHIGKAFGRSRPATGFSLNLSALIKAERVQEPAPISAIYALLDHSDAQWAAIKELRASGQVVITDFGHDALIKQRCDQELIASGQHYHVQPLETESQ